MGRSLVAMGAVAGAVIVGVIILAGDLSRSADLRHISRSIGMTLPPGCIDVELIRQDSSLTVAHLRLPPGRVETFLREEGFLDGKEALTPWIDLLTPGNRLVPHGADLAFRRGEDDRRAWTLALDRNSGRMWVVIRFSEGSAPVR